MTAIHVKLRHVSATPTTLAILMDDGKAVYLNADDMAVMLTEIAAHAPGLLHRALERRLVKLIAAEVSDMRG